ncbi:hypothetical protein MRY87_05580, partial [bacterium]|nr:hypothetical protein [bacterium]
MSTEKFHTLRHQHPMFSFVGMEVRWPSSPDRDHRTLLAVQFDYEIEALDSFSSTFSFPLPREPLSLEERQHTEELLFRLGMIEALSYWKLTCSPYFVVPAGALTTAEVPFWEALFYEGLSEFRYRNEIPAGPSLKENDPFISFIGEITPGERTPTPRFGASGAIIPIGGGKDSIVTLEVLQQQRAENTLFFLNPRPACLRTAAVAGYTEEECLLVRRDLDEKIKHYNAKGFLNGHTPFSALLGFTTVVSAFIHQKQEIVLSNEGSASEGNVLGADVNHQYSKSFHFEEIFSDYVRQFLAPDITYFSLLRPLNEVQIGAAFAKCDQYFTIFRSCNVGCYTDSWCCTCPKCLFTAL